MQPVGATFMRPSKFVLQYRAHAAHMDEKRHKLNRDDFSMMYEHATKMTAQIRAYCAMPIGDSGTRSFLRRRLASTGESTVKGLSEPLVELEAM